MAHSFDDYLADLKADFPRRQVLYAEDLVDVLSKPSVRAINAARERGTLGVEFKKIGGRWCATLRDVATLLACQQETAVAPALNVKARASVPNQKKDPVAPLKRPRRYASLVPKIMGMARLVALSEDGNERGFWSDVLAAFLAVGQNDSPIGEDLGCSPGEVEEGLDQLASLNIAAAVDLAGNLTTHKGVPQLDRDAASEWLESVRKAQ